MQFDRAEPIAPAAPPVCGLCSRSLSGSYYKLQDRSVCGVCVERMQDRTAGGRDSARFLRALLFGVAAGAAGGGLNWFIASRWDLYVGWLSILVGAAVGFAVRLGSGGRGGRAYQVLAVALSYLATAAMFVPIIQRRAGAATIAELLRPLWVLLAAPFINVGQGLLLWSILGFTLTLAWRVNRSLAGDLRGPFVVGTTTPPGGSGGV
jgi:hypothetical protein